MKNKETAIQFITAAAGAALAYYGFRKGGMAGGAAGVVGAGLAASTLAAMTTSLGETVNPCEVRESIEVTASPERAFEMWSHFECFPDFMKDVLEVRKTGERTFHWEVETPLGRRIEWDSELTAIKPGRFIAWRSTTPGVSNRGEIHFEPTPTGTQVMVIMRYERPDGPIASIMEKVAGDDPRSKVREDLRRFKALIEMNETAREANHEITG